MKHYREKLRRNPSAKRAVYCTYVFKGGKWHEVSELSGGHGLREYAMRKAHLLHKLVRLPVKVVKK